LVLDLRELLPPDLRGQAISLFDAELHPEFRDNRYLFICYGHPASGGPSVIWWGASLESPLRSIHQPKQHS